MYEKCPKRKLQLSCSRVTANANDAALPVERMRCEDYCIVSQ
jgi:hypothetical protein